MRAVSVGLLLCGPVLSARAESGLVTWLHPQEDGRLGVESACEGVAVRVQAPDGAQTTDAAALKAAGWEWSDGGFWQTPHRSGGGRLLITVTGLPAGAQEVYLRYFSQPRVPGSPWWFALQVGLEDGREAKAWLDQNADRIIAATGGHDPKTGYETRIGIVGTEELPTTQVTLWVQRYEWSELARIGSIRIETAPSMHASTTRESSPANDRIRAALLANGPEVGGKPAYGIAVLSGTLKVRPKSFDSLAGQQLPAQVGLAAAKGEYGRRQVVVYSPDRDLTDVTLECSALTSEDGHTIPEGELLFAPVGYCPCSVTSDLSIHGYWPDPILTFLKQFAVTRGDVQSLWHRLHVPPDAEAGVYRGTLTVRPKEAPPCTLPVELRVWDFARPQWPRLRVVVGINRPGEFQMSYGLNPSTVYGFQDEWTKEFPKWAEAGATAINRAYLCGEQLDQQTKLPTEAQLDEGLAQIRTRDQAATEAGLCEACYVYMFDEATAEWDPAMRMISARLRKEFPDLLLLTTAARPLCGAGTIEDINGWCPLTYRYSPAAAEDARRAGRQVWWYTCSSPDKPFANLMMTSPAMDARLLMGFMALAYQTDGFLYYSTVFGYFGNRPAITGGAYTSRSLEDNAHDHLYQKGPDGPLPSLRLEAMRDGLEDYDLLWQARADAAEMQERGLVLTPELTALQRRVAPLSAPGNELVESLTSYSEDPQRLEVVREKVAEYVEQAGPAIAAWESFSEPNTNLAWTLPAYSELIRIAGKTIKARRPEALIATGGFASPGIGYAEACLKRDADHVIDPVLLHPYAADEALDGALQGITDACALAGRPEVAVALNETGRPTWDPPTGCTNLTPFVSEAFQAQSIVKLHVQALAYRLSFVTYLVWNDFTEQSDHARNMGLVRVDGSPKPSLGAYRFMTRTLGNRSVADWTHAADGTRVYHFAGDRPVWVMWNALRATEVTLDVGDASVFACDLYGAKLLATPQQDELMLQVSAEPVYVVAR